MAGNHIEVFRLKEPDGHFSGYYCVEWWYKGKRRVSSELLTATGAAEFVKVLLIHAEHKPDGFRDE